MPGAVAVVLTLGSAGETRQPVGGANGAEAVFAAGDEFMDVDLVADIPHKPVFRGLEDAVQGEGQLYHPQVGAHMPTRARQAGDQLMPNLVCQLFELAHRQLFDVGRTIDHIQESTHVVWERLLPPSAAAAPPGGKPVRPRCRAVRRLLSVGFRRCVKRF